MLHTDINPTPLLNVKELDEVLNERYSGIIFCFGTSLISRVIQAKTKIYEDELVPSHVALYYGDNIYESTTSEATVGYKRIKQGVRRWLIKDFIKAEYRKQTKYVVFEVDYLEREKADEYVHLPYGKDTILDFLLKDGSDGDSHGLICSQYANLVLQILPNKKCPTPADLYRKIIQLTGGQNNNND